MREIDEGRVAGQRFSVLFQRVPSFFSLYCCSLEECEHFPTNAIKYLIPTYSYVLSDILKMM